MVFNVTIEILLYTFFGTTFVERQSSFCKSALFRGCHVPVEKYCDIVVIAGNKKTAHGGPVLVCCVHRMSSSKTHTTAMEPPRIPRVFTIRSVVRCCWSSLWRWTHNTCSMQHERMASIAQRIDQVDDRTLEYD